MTDLLSKFSGITELTLWHLQRSDTDYTWYSVVDINNGVLPNLERLQIMDRVRAEHIQAFRDARHDSGLPLPIMECYSVIGMNQWEADRRWAGLVQIRHNAQIVLGEHLEKMAPLRYFGWDWAYYDARWGLDMPS